MLGNAAYKTRLRSLPLSRQCHDSVNFLLDKRFMLDREALVKIAPPSYCNQPRAQVRIGIGSLTLNPGVLLRFPNGDHGPFVEI
jgi:hypothetical protein